jgi:hypothetical protein
MTSSVANHRKLLELHAGSMQLRSLKSISPVAFYWPWFLKTKGAMTSSVADHRKLLEAARFQRDRKFGFQPNISSRQRCSVESKKVKAALKS